MRNYGAPQTDFDPDAFIAIETKCLTVLPTLVGARAVLRSQFDADAVPGIVEDTAEIPNVTNVRRLLVARRIDRLANQLGLATCDYLRGELKINRPQGPGPGLVEGNRAQARVTTHRSAPDTPFQPAWRGWAGVHICRG